MQTLKSICEECRLSIGIMTEILDIPKSTYQCYENGSRPVPVWVQQDAEQQLERSRKYWSELDARIDAHLKGGL